MIVVIDSRSKAVCEASVCHGLRHEAGGMRRVEWGVGARESGFTHRKARGRGFKVSKDGGIGCHSGERPMDHK